MVPPLDSVNFASVRLHFQITMKIIFKSVEFYCVIGILICFAIFNYGQVRIEEVALFRSDSKEMTQLPILQKMNDGERFRVSFAIANPLNVPYDLNIIPDDCAESIVINGNEISLSDYSEKCNFQKGFWLTDSILSPNRVGDRTVYSVDLKNKGGNAGINVFSKVHSCLLSLMKIMIAVFSGLITVSLARRFKWNAFLLLFVFLGVLLRFAMFYALPYTRFTQDVDGHLAYIQYITDNHTIPETDKCWTCYHPPVYYTSAVPSLLISTALGFNSTSGIQAFSLLLSIVLLLGGIALLKEVVAGKPLMLATALWTVWPTLLLVAPRIGNDQMFYALHVLSLLAGFKYIKNGTGSNLIFAVVCTALAIWTKSTGLVSLTLAVIIAIAGYFNNRSQDPLKRFEVHVPSKTEIISWALLLLVFVGLLIEKIVGEGDLISNATSLHSRLIVGNEAKNFLYFDLKTFLTEPYTSAWTDGLGREYFFNYALKSSLFGEFKLVETAVGKTLATLLSITLLGMIAFAIRGWWKTRYNVYHSILFVQGILFVIALGYLRYKYPYACSNDFRYIMPALLSFFPYVGLGIYQECYSLKWKTLGTITVIVFVVSSVMLMSFI